MAIMRLKDPRESVGIIKHYIVYKTVIFAISAMSIFFGIASALFFKSICVFSVSVDLIVAISLGIIIGRTCITEWLSRLIFCLIILIIATYPLAWDDLAYALVLPKIFLGKNSFAPIYEYTAFTYFPFVDYADTIITYAFGNHLQPIFYRLERVVLLLSSIILIFEIIRMSCLKQQPSKKLLEYAVLLVLTSVSAFSLFSFVKPEAFIYVCFLIGVYSFLAGDFIGALTFAIVGLPFKATSIFTLIPLVVLSLIGLRKNIRVPSLYEVVGLIAIITVTTLWLWNNYIYTGDPLYPFAQSIFPYNSDGVLDASNYNSVVDLLKAQRDVSIRNLYSIPLYLKNIVTQLGFNLFFIPLFLLLLSRFHRLYNKNFLILSALVLVSTILFLYYLFNEFRYAYGLMTVIFVSTSVYLISNSKPRYHKMIAIGLIIAVVLQLAFVVVRNIKNSVFNTQYSYYPVNLGSEQLAEVQCVNGLINPVGRVATFEQTFYLWKPHFFFLHELNEYVGMNPSSQQIKYAFEKFNVKYILLPDSYLDPFGLTRLDFGGNFREMPTNVMRAINKNYQLVALPLEGCSNTHVYELVTRK